MTGVVAFKKDGAVSFVTDGAAYDAKGTLLHAFAKSTALPHINAIVAVRCDSGFALPIITQFFATATSFDDLRARSTRILPEAMDLVRAICTSYQVQSNAAIEVFVGGVTNAGEPDAYVVTNSDMTNGTMWTVSTIDDLAMAPADPAIHREAWETIQGRSIDQMDPRTDGLAILTAQRNHRITRTDGALVYGVGCFAQLMQIHRDGRIETEILHRWPEDKIGHPIEPHGPPTDFWKP